jgi:hypothetical protein
LDTEQRDQRKAYLDLQSYSSFQTLLSRAYWSGVNRK